MAKKEAPKQDDLAAILAAIGPAPSGAAGQQRQINYFGPPEGYYATPDFQKGMQPGFVPFQDGDQYGPAFDPPEKRARLQAKMNAIGLYGTDGYRSGVWGPDDAKAYSAILETANASGITDAEEALDRFAAQQAVKSPKVKAPRAPLVTRLYDQQAIRMTVQDSARKILGQALPDEEADRIMSAYQAYDAATQRNLYSAQTPEGPGGTVTQAMSPEEYARTEVERARPVEAGSQRYLDAFDKIVGSLGTMVKPPDLYGGG